MVFGSLIGALARIMKLPIIFERAPIILKNAVGKTKVEHALAREPSWCGVPDIGATPWQGTWGAAPSEALEF